jgi:hypothetical protein
MDNGLPNDKPVTLKDIAQISKDKHHKNMQNRMHRIDDSYQIPGEKPMSTADKPTSKFTDAMTQVLANEAEINEKKKVKPDFLDMDGDGNEKEPMKKAIKDKEMKKEEATTSMDPDDKMWKVSYDHGPHQSNTIKVKAKSQSHAWEVAKEVAKKEYGHDRITSGSVTQVKEETEVDESDFKQRQSVNGLKKMIDDHDARARNTTSPLKKDHHRKMSQQLRDQLADMTKETELDESEKKLASLQSKINALQDRYGLARERRKMSGNRQQGSTEMKIQSKIDDLRNQHRELKRSMTTEEVDEGAVSGKFPVIMPSANGDLLFAVDSQETFGIIKELERMGLGEADHWGDMEFNPELSQDWQAKFAKIPLIKANTANNAWAKYSSKLDKGYDTEDDVMIEYAEKLFGFLTKYAIEYDEDEDEVNEAVTLDYSRYMRAHGKKPHDAGMGSSTWMFTTAEFGDPREDEIFQFQGSFADAKKAAAKWAKSQGEYRFYVME